MITSFVCLLFFSNPLLLALFGNLIPSCENVVSDTEKKHLIIEFNNGLRYEYLDVPHQTFTQMRMSESQGKFFKTKIEKNYKFKKL